MSRGGVHNALGRGQLPSALSRAVGDTVGSSGLERYGETLTPILDLWEQPEFAYLRAEYLLSQQVTAPAVAGEFPGAALVNPDGSGSIVIVEDATFQAAAVNFCYPAIVAAATALATFLTGGARGFCRDTRNIGPASAFPGRAQLWYGTDAALVGVALEVLTNPGANLTGRTICSVPMILAPGWAFVMQGGTVNTSDSFSFKWRERKAFPGELV